MLSRDEWDVYQRVLGGFARTYIEQQAVGREELDAAPAIKALDFSLFDHCLWAVMYTVSILTSEDVKSKIKALRGQFDVTFFFYQPLPSLCWQSSCAEHETFELRYRQGPDANGSHHGSQK